METLAEAPHLMLESSRQRLLDSLGDEEVVLDVGGWADPFERADWVIDLMPYESRGLYRRKGWVAPRATEERFGAGTWIQRDICDREPYPFADDQIDFVVCSQTLEDVRDPIWVCSELIRIAKAGYIEVPSRLEEQSWGVNGPFVGWSHHRWVIGIGDGEITFAPKLHALHAHKDWQFPPGFWEQLSDAERVQTLWWQERFSCRELTILDDEQAESYFKGFVDLERSTRPASRRSVLRRLLRPRPSH